MGAMSLDPVLQSIYPPMTKPEARSTLYRLIEAGQLAHKALLVPLLDRGLEAGDDAVIFVLHAQLGANEQRLAEELGIEVELLQPRLNRLIERDIVARQAIGPDLVPGLALTERGERIREVLAANWEQLEEALFADLNEKKRKGLAKALKRFVELLRLD
jgi:DNA-binding MarR family transcriptional regulator